MAPLDHGQTQKTGGNLLCMTQHQRHLNRPLEEFSTCCLPAWSNSASIPTITSTTKPSRATATCQQDSRASSQLLEEGGCERLRSHCFRSPFRAAWNLLEFLQLRSFDRRASVSSSLPSRLSLGRHRLRATCAQPAGTA
jgi:hypothetical protein